MRILYKKLCAYIIIFTVFIPAVAMHTVTALQQAAALGELDTCTTMLANKADVNQKSDGGYTALNYAINVGDENVKVCELLLKAKAHINDEADFHCKPLYFAARGGHKKIVKLLIDHKAQVDSVNEQSSPLWGALENGHYAVCDMLLHAGARTKDIKDDNMKLAIQILLHTPKKQAKFYVDDDQPGLPAPAADEEKKKEKKKSKK